MDHVSPNPRATGAEDGAQRGLVRRQSSVSAVFGAGALRQLSSMRRSTTSFSPSPPPRVEAPPLPPSKPLFSFRQHVAIREASRSHQRIDDAQMDSGATPSSNIVDEQRRRDREQRRIIVAEALGSSSLAHLVVETRKDKLPLQQHEHEMAREAIHNNISDNSVMSSINAGFDGVPADDDELWRTVSVVNAAQRNRRKQQQSEGVRGRIVPKWWRHLSLRDFSDFLTPGLFCDEELEVATDSDEETAGAPEGSQQLDAATSGNPHDSLDVMSATTEHHSTQIAMRSTANIVSKKQKAPLHLSHNMVNPWTQHVSARPLSHWTTPRRHGVHSGKSFAEIGTLTTVSTRDFVAAANSLIGICQAQERVDRLTVERQERSEVASAYQAFSSLQRPREPAADCLLILSVAEAGLREDIVEAEAMALEWLITLCVVLPCEIAIAERECDRAIAYRLNVYKERLARDTLGSEDLASFDLQL